MATKHKTASAGGARQAGDKPVRGNPARPGLGLGAQLCFALYSTSLAMTKLYKPLLEPLGLTYPQYLVMLALWEHDSQAVGELGARLYLDSGTLTPLLKRMEAASLITRNRAPDDERRVVVALSQAGKELRDKAASVPASVAAACGGATPELVALIGSLRSLRSTLTGVE